MDRSMEPNTPAAGQSPHRRYRALCLRIEALQNELEATNDELKEETEGDRYERLVAWKKEYVDAIEVLRGML